MNIKLIPSWVYDEVVKTNTSTQALINTSGLSSILSPKDIKKYECISDNSDAILKNILGQSLGDISELTILMEEDVKVSCAKTPYYPEFIDLADAIANYSPTILQHLTNDGNYPLVKLLPIGDDMIGIVMYGTDDADKQTSKLKLLTSLYVALGDKINLKGTTLHAKIIESL